MNVKDYLKREKQVFGFGGSIVVGLGLWMNHYLVFGSLDLFDKFPSHESVGGLFILFGFIGIFGKMFNYNYPNWLKVKNSRK